MSVPLNILAVAGFFMVNRLCVKYYDIEHRPRLYRKWAKWNKENPNRLFFITGILLFMAAIACETCYIKYDAARPLFLDAIYIPAVRPDAILFILFIAPIYPSGFLATIVTFICWLFGFISRKAAWIMLFTAFFLLMTFNVWTMLPQNVFIRAIKPIYDKQMRLLELSKVYTPSTFTNRDGKFFYPEDLIAELKEKYDMSSGNTIVTDHLILKITPEEDHIYAFESQLRRDD